MAEEASLNLDKKLFELLLAISRCLDNVEEMLNTSVLSSEEAAVQQVLYEVHISERRFGHISILLLRQKRWVQSSSPISTGCESRAAP